KINYGGKITETNSSSNRDPIRNVHNVRFGMDYQFTKKTVVGAIFAAYDNVWKMKAKNDVTVIINQKLDTVLQINNDEINHWKNVMGNMNIQHTINTDSKITADLDYVYYSDNNPNTYLNAYYNGNGAFLFDENTKSSKLTPINIFAAKVDYTGKIGKKVDVESGVKVSNSEFTNDVGVAKFYQNAWRYDDSLTAKFKLKEVIAAAYTSFNIVVNDKTTVKAGLRYEHTTSNLGTDIKKNIVDRHYGRLFPTLFLSRKIDDKNSFNLSYSRRITRPTFNDLAPFVIFLDPTTFISGNPALQPSVSDAVKGDYLYKNFIFSLTYTYEKDPIASFQTKVDPKTNKQYISAENLNYQKTLNASFSLPFTITNWWNMQNNLTGEWQQIKALYNNAPITVEQKNLQLFSSQNFKLPKDFSIELSGFYQSGGLFGRSIFKSIYSVNFGIQKKISERAGSLRFGVDNIFNSLKFKANQNYPEYNLVSRASLNFTNRIFKLTYTCKFGNSVLKSQRNRTTGSEEERGRVQ
ncbi:MAG TPA: outer membrane beta-barrel family protein, partial [Segetibacter sp.]